MSSAPADLLQFRTDTRAVTGLGAVDVGIVGDGAHQRTGGYHEARDVLTMIGRYHGPASANVGSSGEDYSARQARDRNGLTNSASASDVGSQWPHGGRAAWLRWNNLVYQEMRDRPGNLPALRAVNICLDGRTKQRYDQLHRGDGLIPSTDTVDTHTHLELWRDTEGNRVATLNRLVQLMHAAIDGTTPAPVTGGNDMGTLEGDQARRLNNLDQFVFAIANGDTVAHGVTSPGWTGSDRPVWLTAKVSEIAADAKASRVAVEALAAAINKGGGSVDSATIIAHMDQLAAAETGREQDMLNRIAELEAELEQARHAQHNAAQAEADATADHA